MKLLAKRQQETARMFDERYEQAKAWQVFVAHARKTSKPLYYVRTPGGTTLDCVASFIEARPIAEKAGASIYELRLTQLTKVA